MHSPSSRQLSILPLLPLGLLAIVSYALDNRIPIGIGYALQNLLLDLARNLIPAFFAISVAFMLPAINRSLQLFSVGLNYILLSSVSIALFPTMFTQPTAWVLSSLSATLFFLPAGGEESGESMTFSTILMKAAGVMLIPTLVLLALVIVIKNVEHSILLTFTSVFVNSFLSCLFVPIYEVILSLGFSSILNSLVSLQSESTTIQAILNSILMTNIFALPAVIMTRAAAEDNKARLFLCLLAVITTLTSNIGACVSIELLILLFFFPGSLIALSLSAIAIFFICCNLELSTFTNFYMLYQPDLVLKNLTFLQLSNAHCITMCLAVAIPVVIQLLMLRLTSLSHLRTYTRTRNTSFGYKVNSDSEASLIELRLIKAIGGTENLHKVELRYDSLFVEVGSADRVNTTLLYGLNKKKISFIKDERRIELKFGDKSGLLYKWLNNIVRDSLKYTPNTVTLSEQFDIHAHYLKIQEKSKIERHRLDTD